MADNMLTHKYLYRFTLPTAEPTNSVTLAEVYGLKAAQNFYASLAQNVKNNVQLTTYKMQNQVAGSVGKFLAELDSSIAAHKAAAKEQE